MKSPRERFQTDPIAVGQHLVVVDQTEVLNNLQVAFAELCWQLPNPSDVSGVTANAQRAGAKRLIETFIHLADKQAPAAPRTAGKLEPQ